MHKQAVKATFQLEFHFQDIRAFLKENSEEPQKESLTRDSAEMLAKCPSAFLPGRHRLRTC